jgi:thiol-disulfide isomerase/thioredoxin
MIRVRTAVAVVSAALLVTACGGAEGEDAASPARGDASLPATATPAPQQGPAGEPSKAAAVPAALRFTAKTLDGKDFEGASLAGKRVVFWFWAPWCPKCLSEAPAVKAAARKFGEVAFVGVAGLDTEAAMREFVQSTGTGTIVHLSDEKGAVWTKLGVSQQSTFVFMKPDGSTAKASGPLSPDTLNGLVQKLIAA